VGDVEDVASSADFVEEMTSEVQYPISRLVIQQQQQMLTKAFLQTPGPLVR
jgi:hypothetical protein